MHAFEATKRARMHLHPLQIGSVCPFVLSVMKLSDSESHKGVPRQAAVSSHPHRAGRWGQGGAWTWSF